LTRPSSPGGREEEAALLTVMQTAKLIQVSENHVYGLVAQKAIPHVRFGKLIRIPRWGLLQYIAASGVPLPANLEVALPPASSVHGQRPNEEEG
jgi:excisionase family DNA binding protein